MTRLLVCGGRYYGRIPSLCPPALINARIIRSTEEVRQLQADLLEIHQKSAIEVLEHFNRRGAERLAAHWARISGITERDPLFLERKLPVFQDPDICAGLLRAERIDLLLQYQNNENEGFLVAATRLGIETRVIDPDAAQKT